MVAKKRTVPTAEATGRSRRATELLWYLVGVVALVLVNVLAAQFFFRLDLTADRRYSVSPATKKLLSNLDDVVYVEVYLEGDFPAPFQRLQRSVRETLEIFRAYGGRNVQYKFVDPSAIEDTKGREAFYLQLTELGLQPTNLFATENNQRTEKIIFPGAMISYGGREAGVMLLKGNQQASSGERLNQSVEGVEYELAAAIKNLTYQRRPRVGLVRGHGELDDLEAYDLITTLQQRYDVQPLDLPNRVDLAGLDAVIVARPDTALSEPDKFKLDQYLINGGNLLFFINAMQVSLDSIGPEGSLAMPYELNLGDMLFRYGVRINADLIQDLSALQIPMFVGYEGNTPQTRPMPWRFFPVVNQFGDHPTVRNLDALALRFVSTLDTVKAEGIRKTPLLFTSRYSRILPAPVRVNFNDARLDPDPRQFRQGDLPVAYLLEGTFRSLYANRLAPRTEVTFDFKEQNRPGKLLVCADGDLLRNEINPTRREPYPLGYDRVSRFTFANKEFLLNVLEYMLDDEGVIISRNKQVVLRPLDRVRIREERLFWQMVNLGGPLVLLALFGVVRFYRRRRRYGRIQDNT